MADINEIINYLAGTANTVEQALNLFEVPPEERLKVEEKISEELFLCESCGWWDTLDELYDDTGEELCPDCTN